MRSNHKDEAVNAICKELKQLVNIKCWKIS
jgi:hypothetical protein